MNYSLLAIVDADLRGPLFVLFLFTVIILAIWEAIWKFIALWKSARNGQLGWFVCIAIFNTVGILPIIYILACQKNRNLEPVRAA